MKNLNVRQESIKIPEENTSSNLCHLGWNNFLLDMSPQARETKAKMNYWDSIKIKSFCTAKETVNKTKRKWTEWEKMFANVLSDKGLVSKIYKELIKLNIQGTNNLFFNLFFIGVQFTNIQNNPQCPSPIHSHPSPFSPSKTPSSFPRVICSHLYFFSFSVGFRLCLLFLFQLL